MTDQAHCADIQPANESGAAPLTKGINPDDRPRVDRAARPPLEIGGRQGPEPTRYGDWELRGRCIDF
jgi:hypothetical protein